jgi:GGDEF domain-containing protein
MGVSLRAHTRETDGLGRWRGEEFVLVCPGMTLDKAAELAERLHRRIKETNFIPDDPLYLAKSRGRNCAFERSSLLSTFKGEYSNASAARSSESRIRTRQRDGGSG